MEIILPIAILIFSVVIHEVSHGYAAYFLGDPTAKYAGRLTLNPLKHLDPWGSFLVPLFLTISHLGIIFGWAKPVPYNPYNLSNQKYGPALVGVAGPLSNLALALLAGVMIRIMLVIGVEDGFFGYNILALLVVINVFLIVFNLLPIPPLDGSKLLFAFLPVSEYTKAMLEQYGFVFLLLFLYVFSDLLRVLENVVLGFFTNYVVGVNIFMFLQ